MRERYTNIRRIFQRIGFYIPVTWYFVLFCVAAFTGYRWLKAQALMPDSAYKDVFELLLRFALLFGMAIFTVAFVTVLASIIYFGWKKQKGGIDLRISTAARSDESRTQQTIAIHLHPILKPLLGFIKLRLRYDQAHYSEKFSIVKAADRKLFSTSIDGSYNWQLPEIREYRIERAILYFEDFFQFFSIAVTLNTSNSFYTQPVTAPAKAIHTFPRKTEETSTRIEELKKVEGELINYKNFESNDDVRRIVWKIYARNKELVVRVPEILDPYASHLYFYPSFFTAFDVKGNEVIEVPFLNYYKTMIWSAYRQLLRKGFDVRYRSDQEIAHSYADSEEEQTKYAISTSRWQQNLELKDFVKGRDASVVILSSLSDPEQVRTLLESHGSDISFIFIPLSTGLRRQNVVDWLQWFFMQQEKDQAAMYKTSWSLSVLRAKVRKNEKDLRKLMKEYDKVILGTDS